MNGKVMTAFGTYGMPLSEGLHYCGSRRDRKDRKVLNEIIADFPILGRDAHIQIHETQKSPNSSSQRGSLQGTL